MTLCTYHPERPAVEHCEVCQQPLCDLCLWYADDGRRLCVSHARAYESTGGKIYSPDTYDDGIYDAGIRSPSDAALSITESPPVNRIPYRGNSHDVNALIAALVGVTSLASCFGFMYCFPFIAGILGLVSVMNAKYALDPKRTRTLGYIGLGVGIAGLIPILLFIGYMGIMALAISISAATGNLGP